MFISYISFLMSCMSFLFAVSILRASRFSLFRVYRRKDFRERTARRPGLGEFRLAGRGAEDWARSGTRGIWLGDLGAGGLRDWGLGLGGLGAGGLWGFGGLRVCGLAGLRARGLGGSAARRLGGRRCLPLRGKVRAVPRHLRRTFYDRMPCSARRRALPCFAVNFLRIDCLRTPRP